jgi:hypothetical protein
VQHPNPRTAPIRRSPDACINIVIASFTCVTTQRAQRDAANAQTIVTGAFPDLGLTAEQSFV